MRAEETEGSGEVVLKIGRDDCGDASWDLLAGFFWDYRMRLDLFFVTEIFIKIIVDLHTVVRNNSEFFFIFCSISHNSNIFCKTVVQYHNLETDIYIIH